MIKTKPTDIYEKIALTKDAYDRGQAVLDLWIEGRW